MNSTTAKTIKADNAANIVALAAAPIINPIVTANATKNIATAIPIQLFFLQSLLQ